MINKQVLPSNPSVQMWRQEVVTVDGALVGTEYQSWITDGKWECRFVSCAHWSCGFWAPADLQQGLCQQDRSWFCTSWRHCLTFPWTANFLTGAETPGQRHLSGAGVMKDVAGWPSFQHLQCGLQMSLMEVPYHWCILRHWMHKAFVAMCLDI